MNAVFDISQKDLRTMNSKRFAVFAASTQCADAVKVVSRGTLGSRTVRVLGNTLFGVCRGERRRKWREVPEGEACKYVGLIGRSYFSAQVQAEESEDWDRGYTIFTSSEMKAEPPRAARRSLMYDRKGHGPATEPFETPR